MKLSEFLEQEIEKSFGATGPVAKYLKSDMFERWIDDWYKDAFQSPPPAWLAKKYTKKEEIIREDG